jgi:hypothetical protein
VPANVSYKIFHEIVTDIVTEIDQKKFPEIVLDTSFITFVCVLNPIFDIWNGKNG